MRNAMSVTEAFGEVASNLAQLAPEKVVALRAPESMSSRVAELVAARQSGELTADETTELDQFLALDLFITLAKARARLLLAQ